MLVESVLRRINENLLNYFINLPESIWLSGFLDQVNLKDVMLNTRAFSNEWYSLDIPFRLKYGHIRRASIQVLLAHSKLVMEVEGVVLIVGPNLAYKSYEDVIRNSMDNVFGLVELFKHIQTIRYNNDGFGEGLGPQKGEVSENLFNINSSSKEGLNALLRWLFRYVPDLSLSIRNLYIRYEDDVLDTSHPMSAGIHINSVTINPARNCWEFQWPTEEKEQIGFISKDNSNTETDPANLGKPQHPLSINNSSADPRGIFSIKVKGLSAFWDDESAPFIPVSLLEQTEVSNDKFGVFSAVTIDDIQNLVNSNLQYHTRIISNLNISAQFGFVNPFIHKLSIEKNSQSNGSSGSSSSSSGSSFGKSSPSDPASSHDSSTSSSSTSKNKGENNGYIAKDYLSDYYTGSNIATLLNINIQSGFEINVYPQMIHGLVRFVTLYNQFQFWTQVRKFRPVERPGNGKTPTEIRTICRDWWIFSLKYYRNIKYKDNKHNSLKDEINYRVERKKYIKIIKKWKWIEFMITGKKPISDSGTVIHRTDTGVYNVCTLGGKCGPAEAERMDEYAKSLGSSISFFNSNLNSSSSLSSILGLSSQIINHLSVSFNLSRYWQYDVEILQKVSEKSDDVRCILTVLQHHSYWVISQWHILAEREFEIEFALFQNGSTIQKKQKGAVDVFSDVNHNMDIKTKNILTLLAYGLHIQTESSVWELISRLRESYTDLIRRIAQDDALCRRIKDSLQNKSSLLSGGSVFEFGINSGISAGVPAQISNLIQENIERHPYVIFGSGIFDKNSIETDVLSDFFGVGLDPRFIMKRRDWHPIRLRLHLWGRFYDEYFEAFPLAISETIEINQLMNLSYHLDFQQMNKLCSISMQSESLSFSTLASSHATSSYPMEDIDMSMGITNVTMARPKNQQVSVSERDPEFSIPSSSLNKLEKPEENRNEIIDHGGKDNQGDKIEILNLGKSGIGMNQVNKEHLSMESNEMVEEESIIDSASVKKKAFKFEKKLPYVFKDSSNVPEWLSDLAGPGISLPKIISNKIIGICIPKFEINICHLVSENKKSSGIGKAKASSREASTETKEYSASTSNGFGGIKRSYHSLTRYFSKNGQDSSNINMVTSIFTPRKLFGIVITGLGFNMSTCTSLRISSCFKRMEVIVWNYNDSNLMREFISSIKSDRSVSKKMIRDEQIVIFSMSDERQNTSIESLSSNCGQNEGNKLGGVTGVSGSISVSVPGSSSRLGEVLGIAVQVNNFPENFAPEGGIDGNKVQTPNRRNSSSLNEYDSSPSLTHYVDETHSGTFSSYTVGNGRQGGLVSSKTVRFEDPRGISNSSSALGINSSSVSGSFDAIRTTNSELSNESSLGSIKNDNLNTTSVPVPASIVNNGQANGISRYMRRWNYLSCVMLPPNNSCNKENKGEVRGSGESNFLSFVFKLPFYLKMDINLTPVTIVLNEQLLDNIRSEIMKLVQVCLLTIWSQYKGLGAFPVTVGFRGLLIQEGSGVIKENPQEENNFELLLCHPFNLSLNKYNAINKLNTPEWNKINSLLNKVHARISIRLPSVELYMLNESIEYFRQIDGDLFMERDADERLENVSFDLSTSFKFSVESQTILIGTIIDKLRGNINRLYFRGFQMKFDTQQNITSIIRLYLRFKNLLSDRYGNIIAIINLFKDYKFDHISRHSLTSFTDEILRLQCEKLPDTNNILLKEFTLSLDEKSGTRLEIDEKREDTKVEKDLEVEKELKVDKDVKMEKNEAKLEKNKVEVEKKEVEVEKKEVVEVEKVELQVELEKVKLEMEAEKKKVKKKESINFLFKAPNQEDSQHFVPIQAKTPIPVPVMPSYPSPSVSPCISPSISPAPISSTFLSPTFSANSGPYHSQNSLPAHISASGITSVSSEATPTAVPARPEQVITISNTQTYSLGEKHPEPNEICHPSQSNSDNLKFINFHEDQIKTEINTIGKLETRRNSSKLILIRDTETQSPKDKNENYQLSKERGGVEERDTNSSSPLHYNILNKKQANLISHVGEALAEKKTELSNKEIRPRNKSHESAESQSIPHQHPVKTQKKKPPISLRSGFNFNN
ncbi:VPS13 like involved in vacuolar trafficking [Cryptosporidium sp. chipmunk genotype I]|uniref:VPS13 like involved in vacuolar trafficking n=1 Tax=Cryptosporidium sp. chipmunk genotype I TaxID=1280935 RepID=UPI00351A07D5|nr:VPS13 like involved in vacuolar trafficking [Cryptosporidium sp. chipmunk genotype I]